MKKTNVLLIGFGPHAQRIYYPIAKRDGIRHGFEIVAAIDLESKKSEIELYLKNDAVKPELVFLNTRSVNQDVLAHKSTVILSELVKKYKITAVIIATDPLAHKAYAMWALNNNLNILMDKPITAVPNASTNIDAAKKILSDYIDINVCYLKKKKRNNRLIFSLMTQRRYHGAYQKIKSLVQEVFERTNCPVTSIQSFHSDGQWRLPSEIVDIPYHSYNHGFGKFSHTGYHSMDIMHWLIEAAESDEKKINNMDVFTNVLRPTDFFSQLTTKDYKKIFPNYNNEKKYSDEELYALTSDFGEIDAFSTIAFKHDDRTITLGSLNLVHNGFSQRGWQSCAGRNLYKGNGRLRHETHFIEQGPFQAISFISYQSKEVDPSKKQDVYEVGGEYHLDIHVFRNSSLFSDWKSYEKYSIRNLDTCALEGFSRGHQEDARRKCMLEFIENVRGKSNECISELPSHLRCVHLMSALYQSSALRFNNLNPLVNTGF